MDAVLKAHCNRNLTVFPFDKIEDGDVTYKDPVILLSYYEPKVQMVTDYKGREVVSSARILLDGSDADKISVKDQISMNFIGRVAIIKIEAFQQLPEEGTGWDHLEVYV